MPLEEIADVAGRIEKQEPPAVYEAMKIEE